jgi:predicted RNA-binding protein with TRAM domain
VQIIVRYFTIFKYQDSLQIKRVHCIQNSIGEKYMDRFNGGFRRRNSFAPVKVGDELDVKVEAVGEKGDGIAKKKGFVLFIPDVKLNDEVRIRVTKVLNKVGFAESLGEAQGPIEVDEKPAPRNDNLVEVPVERASEQININEIDTENDTEDFGEEVGVSDNDDDSVTEESQEDVEESDEESQEEKQSDEEDQDELDEDDLDSDDDSVTEESQEDVEESDEESQEEKQSDEEDQDELDEDDLDSDDDSVTEDLQEDVDEADEVESDEDSEEELKK